VRVGTAKAEQHDVSRLFLLYRLTVPFHPRTVDFLALVEVPVMGVVAWVHMLRDSHCLINGTEDLSAVHTYSLDAGVVVIGSLNPAKRFLDHCVPLFLSELHRTVSATGMNGKPRWRVELENLVAQVVRDPSHAG
jgi:hypothetical protein